jgi:hypothetical protein
MFWNTTLDDVMHGLDKLYLHYYNVSVFDELMLSDIDINIDNIVLLNSLLFSKSKIIKDIFNHEIKRTESEEISSILYQGNDLLKSPHYSSYKITDNYDLVVTYKDEDNTYIRKYDINEITLSYKTKYHVSLLKHIDGGKLEGQFNNIMKYTNEYNEISHSIHRLYKMKDKI